MKKFTKKELKELHCKTQKQAENCLTSLGITTMEEYRELEREQREWEEIYKGFSENMFCDNTGFCCGSSCRNYGKCYN